MKKPFNYLFIVLTLSICFIGLQVNIEANEAQIKTEFKTQASKPVYNESNKVFVANGTPITIIEKNDGKTYATWNGGTDTLLSDDTIVVGGSYNPLEAGWGKIELDYDKTSITMNGGKINAIIGGNAITENFTEYSKVHVGTINIDINGGTINQIAGVSPAFVGMNTQLPSDAYAMIDSYYYADKVNIDISNAIIIKRVYICSSYTYAKEAIVNMHFSTIEGANDLGLLAGTNGKIDSFTANVDNCNISNIHAAGLRTMVNDVSVNVTGKSTIGDIYAGSYYGVGIRYEDTQWANVPITSVSYGQAGKMTFTLGDNVVYNNIYAGFQYIDKYNFAEKYKNNTLLNKIASGIENSEKASLTINVTNTPLVKESKVMSMMNSKEKFVKIKYKPKVHYEIIKPDIEVTVPTVGVINKDNVEAVLNNIINTNSEIKELIENGMNLDVKVEAVASIKPKNENDFKKAIKMKAKDAKIVNYFDISILINNIDSGENLTKIENSGKKMELSVVLPDKFKEVPKGYKRVYYIIRDHKGTIEILDTKLSADGNYITFSSDKFSKFALAYNDTPTTVINPDTVDEGIMKNLAIIIVSLLIATGTAIYLRKEIKQRKIN